MWAPAVSGTVGFVMLTPMTEVNSWPPSPGEQRPHFQAAAGVGASRPPKALIPAPSMVTALYQAAGHAMPSLSSQWGGGAGRVTLVLCSVDTGAWVTQQWMEPQSPRSPVAAPAPGMAGPARGLWGPGGGTPPLIMQRRLQSGRRDAQGRMGWAGKPSQQLQEAPSQGGGAGRTGRAHAVGLFLLQLRSHGQDMASSGWHQVTRPSSGSALL